MFKNGQKVWDKAGFEYTYKQKLEQGHLVYKLVEVQCSNYRGDDFYSEFIEGELIVIGELFPNPPKEKQCEEIVALNKAISSLEANKRSIQ